MQSTPEDLTQWASVGSLLIEQEIQATEAYIAQLQTLLDSLDRGAEPQSLPPTDHRAPPPKRRWGGSQIGQDESLMKLVNRVLRDGMTMREIIAAVRRERPEALQASVRSSVDYLRMRDRLRTDGIQRDRRYYRTT